MGFIVAFLFFIQLGESYMIRHNSDLLYDIYNTKNEHNRRQTHYLASIYIFHSFITSSASSLIMISMLSLFEGITPSSSLSMKEIKLFAIVN